MATVRGLKKRGLRLKARVLPDHHVRLPSGPRLAVDLRDVGGLQLAVWGSGRLQPHAVAAWDALLAARRWDLIIDVGANYGEFAVPASVTDAGNVIAVEPNFGVCAMLLGSIRRAGGRATVCGALIGEHPGLATLSVAENSRVGRMAGLDAGIAGERVVPVTTLDELALGLMPADGSLLLKVDVEGAELDVLAGAGALLDRAGPVAMLVETLHNDTDTIIAGAADFDAWGFDRRSGRPVRLESSTPEGAEQPSTRDVLLTRRFAGDALLRPDGC